MVGQPFNSSVEVLQLVTPTMGAKLNDTIPQNPSVVSLNLKSCRSDACLASLFIQMNFTDHYLLVVLFITLCKAAIIFFRLDKFLKCDHSNESY